MSQPDHEHRRQPSLQISVIVSLIGETWAYYVIGSVVEVVLLAAIVRSAWTWPPPQTAPRLP
jgi:hypothetical protein